MRTIKLLAVLALGAAVLSACSDPKSAVIPQDPAQWGKLQRDTRALSDADRLTLARYLARMGMAGVLAGSNKAAIPPGTTVGEAIREEHKFEADQSAPISPRGAEPPA